MISGVLSRYLQSWDISINNSFKNELRKKSLSKKKAAQKFLKKIQSIEYEKFGIQTNYLGNDEKITQINRNYFEYRWKWRRNVHRYDRLLGYYQETVEEVERHATLDNKEEIKNGQDNYIR